MKGCQHSGRGSIGPLGGKITSCEPSACYVRRVSSCVALVTNHKCLASTRSDSRHPILNADELEGMQTYRAQKRCTVHRRSPERRSKTSSEIATAGLQRVVFWIEKDANSFSGISMRHLTSGARSVARVNPLLAERPRIDDRSTDLHCVARTERVVCDGSCAAAVSDKCARRRLQATYRGVENQFVPIGCCPL